MKRNDRIGFYLKSLILAIFFISTIAIKPALSSFKGVDIRVGLATGVRFAVFSSDREIQALIGTKRVFEGNRIEVYSDGDCIRIGNGRYRGPITITPSKGGFISYNDRPYRGRFEVVPKERGLTVINILPLEEYLYGVLKAEVSPSWPFEALKAQAVVSRTFALSNLGRHSREGFDLCAKVHCQGYLGLTGEDPTLNRAVDATRGEVLTYNGSIAKVFYHSDSGGYTASSKSVWGEDIPYLKGKREDFYNDCDSPHKHWSLELPSSKLVEILCENGFEIEAIKDIVITKRDEFSFRALALRIIGTNGSIELPATRFRQMIGYSLLRSTAFNVRKKGASLGKKTKEETPQSSQESKQLSKEERWARARNINVRELLAKGLTYDEIILILAEAYGILERDVAPQDEKLKEKVEFKAKEGETVFVFEGRGWGHGVGMSQWGAKTLAEKGQTYIDILRFYFPETQIQRR